MSLSNFKIKVNNPLILLSFPLLLLCLQSHAVTAASNIQTLETPTHKIQSQTPYVNRPEVKEFIQTLSQKHHLDPGYVRSLFQGVYPEPKIVEAISRPYEAQPWYKYRTNFISDERINSGVAFWKQHAALLKKAEAQYGVPAEIIVAIIGVETSYGQKMGKYPVIQSLSTLAFDYPKRGPFFKSELEQFILLLNEEKLDPKMVGSYAGAIGMPQFMPSSYRRYAVDFSNSGQRDLIKSPADAIGSVANYFKQHGWLHGQKIAQKASVKGTSYKPLLLTKNSNPKPDHSIAELNKAQVFALNPKSTPNPKELAALIELQLDNNAKEHWLGLQNFYVITRYNHSVHYAMAVYQLSQKLKEKMGS